MNIISLEIVKIFLCKKKRNAKGKLDQFIRKNFKLAYVKTIMNRGKIMKKTYGQY